MQVDPTRHYGYTQGIMTAKARHLNEPGLGEKMSGQVAMAKASESNHYGEKEINQIKGTGVKRVYVFQADC